jgi:hypothetical protein
MALTDDEETKVRGLIGVIEASGLTPEQITETLKRGKLTTEREAASAKIRELQKQRTTANAEIEALIQAEQAKIAAINEQLEQ